MTNANSSLHKQLGANVYTRRGSEYIISIPSGRAHANEASSTPSIQY